jgi:hypothetical protein
MIKNIAILLLLYCIPVVAPAIGDDLWNTDLPFEKATIRYAISGVEEGYEVLYIRDFGQKTAKYRSSTMKVMGVEKVTETVEFTDPDWIYTFDLQRRTGVKSANPQKFLYEEFAKLDDHEKLRLAKNNVQLNLGPMLGGMSEALAENVVTILGYPCDKAQFIGAEIYSIHGTTIPLKTEANIMGMRMLVKAVKMEKESAPLPYFEHPRDIIPTYDPQADYMARTLAKEAIAMLKGPGASQELAPREEVVEVTQQFPDPVEEQEMEEAIKILQKMFEK